MKEKTKIHNNTTELDRSGSMNGLENDTIGGFNSLVEKQKKQKGKRNKIMKKTLILFVVLAMACTFVACGSTSSSSSSSSKLKGAKVGDVVTFGTYANEEIEWQVLAKEDNKVLVITKNIIESKPYNTEYEDVTWETCTLRKWLNDDFYNSAFSDNEKSLIQTTKVVNKDIIQSNSKDNIYGGNDTEDKVFLLSLDEANQYFTIPGERECQGTSNAKSSGLYVDITHSEGNSVWWLRSPGEFQNFAECVDFGGYVSDCGGLVCSDYGVRPALWINLA